MFDLNSALPIILFILGAILGSFANVIILRLPQGKSVVLPGSHCPSCEQPIAWYDNIPIFSWILLKGRCRKCRTKISFRYPLVELTMGLLFAACGLWIGWNWTLFEYLILVFALVTVSFIDIDHFILPDVFTLSGIVIGLLGAWLNPERSFFDAILGVFVGGGFLWLVAYFYYLYRKEEGMGGGDIKLIAWLGAVLGWQAVPFIIMSASIIGSLFGFMMMLKNKSGMKTMIPFGPYLALGALIYMFGGDVLAKWYLGLFLPAFM